MYASVLLLRRAGAVAIVPTTRDCLEHDGAKLQGIIERERGGPLTLRRPTAAPRTGMLAELFAPQLVAWDWSTIRCRGFERTIASDKEAGVLQEWIIWPRGS